MPKTPPPYPGAKYGYDKRKRKELLESAKITSANGWYDGGIPKGGPINHLEKS